MEYILILGILVTMILIQLLNSRLIEPLCTVYSQDNQSKLLSNQLAQDFVSEPSNYINNV